MANNYVSFVTNDHLLDCISNLYNSYLSAKEKTTVNRFYRNKVDVFKLIFDSKFNNLSEEELIRLEMTRQIDKSVNNAIGTFHEEVLGGVEGFVNGRLLGYDLKAEDDSLFAEIKNKHNTMNSSSAESAFQRLARFADDNRGANCYLVQILAKNSFHDKWSAIINGKEYSHSRIYKISGDNFYELITGKEDALYDLYRVLPQAISDFLISTPEVGMRENIIFSEINEIAQENDRCIFDEIAFKNFSYFKGFNQLD